VRRSSDGAEITFTPSGILPRIFTKEHEAENINNFACITQTQGKVSDLPEEQEGTFFIVSMMVFAASKREDLIAPDTGKGAIRDEQGRILAVTRFIRR
jgi:hypothetical protein